MCAHPPVCGNHVDNSCSWYGTDESVKVPIAATTAGASSSEDDSSDSEDDSDSEALPVVMSSKPATVEMEEDDELEDNSAAMGASAFCNIRPCADTFTQTPSRRSVSLYSTPPTRLSTRLNRPTMSKVRQHRRPIDLLYRSISTQRSYKGFSTATGQQVTLSVAFTLSTACPTRSRVAKACLYIYLYIQRVLIVQ